MYISAPSPPLCKYLPLSEIRRQEERRRPVPELPVWTLAPLPGAGCQGRLSRLWSEEEAGRDIVQLPNIYLGWPCDYHPQASERDNPFSAASYNLWYNNTTRMDGLLAARVVSMICLGLVTWIVGEDIIYTRVCAMCVIRENQAGSILRTEFLKIFWRQLFLVRGVSVTNLDPFKCDIYNTFTSEILCNEAFVRIVFVKEDLWIASAVLNDAWNFSLWAMLYEVLFGDGRSVFWFIMTLPFALNLIKSQNSLSVVSASK